MARKIAAPLALFALVTAAAGLWRPGPPGATAREVVAEALRAHGAARLDRAEVAFTFRGDGYTLRRDAGRFAYARAFRDSTGAPVRDVLTNEGLTRTVGGGAVPLDARTARGAETTANSVAYFALLPYNLADPAARLRRLPDATVRGEPYRTVEVTFAPDGGGRDHEDRFVYWFHRDRHTMDYLAYLFHTGEGGTRFRIATNPRVVAGVRFADYENYEDAGLGERIEDYPARLGALTLRKLSDIQLEDVRVRPLR